MTPSALRDIYHQARCKAMQRAVEYRNPVVQEECDLEAWEAVLKACATPAEAREDAERYRWLANRVLACDYGDNNAGEIGWRIRHDLLFHNGERQPAFMYGKSIDAAIDAARKEKPCLDLKATRLR